MNIILDKINEIREATQNGEITHTMLAELLELMHNDKTLVINFDDITVEAIKVIIINILKLKIVQEFTLNNIMISGSDITVILSEVINTELDFTVYLNGIYIPKSMCIINETENKMIINFTALSITPSLGDFLIIKYYKK